MNKHLIASSITVLFGVLLFSSLKILHVGESPSDSIKRLLKEDNVIESVFKTNSNNLNYPKIIEKLFTSKSIEDCEKFLQNNGFETLPPSKDYNLFVKNQTSECEIGIGISDFGIMGKITIVYPDCYGEKEVSNILDEFTDNGYTVLIKYNKDQTPAQFIKRDKNNVFAYLVRISEVGMIVMKMPANQ